MEKVFYLSFSTSVKIGESATDKDGKRDRGLFYL